MIDPIVLLGRRNSTRLDLTWKEVRASIQAFKNTWVIDRIAVLAVIKENTVIGRRLIRASFRVH